MSGYGANLGGGRGMGGYGHGIQAHVDGARSKPMEWARTGQSPPRQASRSPGRSKSPLGVSGRAAPNTNVRTGTPRTQKSSGYGPVRTQPVERGRQGGAPAVYTNTPPAYTNTPPAYINTSNAPSYRASPNVSQIRPGSAMAASVKSAEWGNGGLLGDMSQNDLLQAMNHDDDFLEKVQSLREHHEKVLGQLEQAYTGSGIDPAPTTDIRNNRSRSPLRPSPKPSPSPAGGRISARPGARAATNSRSPNRGQQAASAAPVTHGQRRDEFMNNLQSNPLLGGDPDAMLQSLHALRSHHEDVLTTLETAYASPTRDGYGAQRPASRSPLRGGKSGDIAKASLQKGRMPAFDRHNEPADPYHPVNNDQLRDVSNNHLLQAVAGKNPDDYLDNITALRESQENQLNKVFDGYLAPGRPASSPPSTRKSPARNPFKSPARPEAPKPGNYSASMAPPHKKREVVDKKEDPLSSKKSQKSVYNFDDHHIVDLEGDGDIMDRMYQIFVETSEQFQRTNAKGVIDRAPTRELVSILRKDPTMTGSMSHPARLSDDYHLRTLDQVLDEVLGHPQNAITWASFRRYFSRGGYKADSISPERRARSQSRGPVSPVKERKQTTSVSPAKASAKKSPTRGTSANRVKSGSKTPQRDTHPSPFQNQRPQEEFSAPLYEGHQPQPQFYDASNMDVMQHHHPSANPFNDTHGHHHQQWLSSDDMTMVKQIFEGLDFDRTGRVSAHRLIEMLLHDRRAQIFFDSVIDTTTDGRTTTFLQALNTISKQIVDDDISWSQFRKRLESVAVSRKADTAEEMKQERGLPNNMVLNRDDLTSFIVSKYHVDGKILKRLYDLFVHVAKGDRMKNIRKGDFVDQLSKTQRLYDDMHITPLKPEPYGSPQQTWKGVVSGIIMFEGSVLSWHDIVDIVRDNSKIEDPRDEVEADRIQMEYHEQQREEAERSASRPIDPFARELEQDMNNQFGPQAVRGLSPYEPIAVFSDKKDAHNNHEPQFERGTVLNMRDDSSSVSHVFKVKVKHSIGGFSERSKIDFGNLMANHLRMKPETVRCTGLEGNDNMICFQVKPTVLFDREYIEQRLHTNFHEMDAAMGMEVLRVTELQNCLVGTHVHTSPPSRPVPPPSDRNSVSMPRDMTQYQQPAWNPYDEPVYAPVTSHSTKPDPVEQTREHVSPVRHMPHRYGPEKKVGAAKEPPTAPWKPIKMLNATAPRGPSLMDRPKQKTTRQRRLEEDVAKKRAEDAKDHYVPFKANPVPASVTHPRYAAMKSIQDARDRRRKSEAIPGAGRHSVVVGLDGTFKTPEDKSSRKFAANPVSWEISAPLYDQMVKDKESKREASIGRRARMSLRDSSLPPRMESMKRDIAGLDAEKALHSSVPVPKRLIAGTTAKYTSGHLAMNRAQSADAHAYQNRSGNMGIGHAQNMMAAAARERKLGNHGGGWSDAPIKSNTYALANYNGTRHEAEDVPKMFKANRNAPDFIALHKRQAEKMEEKKNRARFVTQPKPFVFQAPNRGLRKPLPNPSDSTLQDKPQPETDPTAAARKRAQMTVAPAKPTQKFLDMQKAAHQKIADDRDKALKKLEKIEESQNKGLKAGALKSRVEEGTANAPKTNNKAIDQKVAQRKADMAEQNREYQDRMQQINDRVANRPLLMERSQLKTAKERARITGLLKVREAMRSANLSEADIDTNFRNDELNLLDEADHRQKLRERALNSREN